MSVIAPLPPDEEVRLQRLQRLDILDSPPEDLFDRLTRLASLFFRVPIALVSLIDRDRQWFKSCRGLTIRETSRDIAFCAHALGGDDLFVVADAETDPRFRDNPLVTGESAIRFYAGVPLTLEPGIRLGTLCVMDTKPHPLGITAEEAAFLRELAALASISLEQRLAESRLGRMEEAYRRTESSYRNVFLNTPIGLYRTSESGEILMANPAILRMTGYDTVEELLRKNVETDNLVSERATFKKHLSQYGSISGYESQWKKRDGSFFLAKESARAVRDQSGHLLYYEGVVEDVTERRQAEEQLRQSEERYRMLFERNPLPAWIFDKETLEFLGVNPAAVRTYGYSEEEFLKMRITEIRDSQEHKKLFDYLAANIDLEEQSGPWRHRTKDGRVVLAQVTAHSIVYNGRPAYLIIVSDVTEITRTHQQLQQALVAAQAAAKAKSEFLATISHEIRTPMNGVIGMTSILLDTELNEEQREYVETIRTSGDALLTVINDVLDFSKIESGRLEFEQVTFDVWTVIEEAVDVLAESAYRKKLDLVALVSEKVPVKVIGDPGRLRQILLNLLSNAVKFTESGEVCLEVSVVEANRETARLRFEIIDTGIGVSPDVRDRLFQAFSQADASTTRRFGGTGLGLAISKRLATAMGGGIGLLNGIGGGSCFWLELPFVLACDQSAPEAATDALVGKRILVVERSRGGYEQLRMLLAGHGATVILAKSTGEAVSLLKEVASSEQKFDICLVNHQESEAQTLALVERVRQPAEHARTPVILLLSRLDRNFSRQAIDAGVDIILHKPLRQRQLLKMILQLLNSQVSLPANG